MVTGESNGVPAGIKIPQPQCRRWRDEVSLEAELEIEDPLSSTLVRPAADDEGVAVPADRSGGPGEGTAAGDTAQKPSGSMSYSAHCILRGLDVVEQPKSTPARSYPLPGP